MNFINLITALIILGIFLSGFSHLIIPAQKLWERAFNNYSTAKTIYFVSETFKAECAKANMDLDSWGKLISSAKELDSYTISELKKDDKLWALRAIFIISGDSIEVLGLVSP